MNKRSTLLLITILFFGGAMHAQNNSVSKQSAGDYCLSVEDFEQLLHAPYLEADPLLESRGYQIAFSGSGEYRDTIDGIILTYSVRTFVEVPDLKSTLLLYTSENGLSNIVKWENKRLDNCSLPAQFLERGYSVDPKDKSWHGSYFNSNEELERVVASISEDDSVLRVCIKNVEEINNFVISRKEAIEAGLLNRVNNDVKILALHDQYIPALALLDSLTGNGPRVDSAINSVRRYVIGEAEEYYLAKLDTLKNSNAVEEGIKCCDTLLLFTQSRDSVSEIRTLLQKQLNGEIDHYSNWRPEEYQEIVKSLEKIINDELTVNVLQEEQRMRMDFTILTKKENESSGKINIGLSSANYGGSSGAVGVIGNRLQRSIDNLAKSNLIRPVRQHGVYITTRDLLSADIRWKYYIVNVKDECDTSNQQLASAVKFIDDHYFTDHDTIKTSNFQQNSEVTVTGRVRKPTRRDYTFTFNEKRMGETIYTDIALTKFKTTGALTWVPSIIIPGIGTKNLGLYSSASARAIPFFLCAALAVTGFWWEKAGATQLNPDMERPTLSEGGATYPWQYQNIGYWVGGGAALIAATIYINELVEGISGSINNLQRSKELRKRLKKGPITVQTQNIRLQ